MWIGENESAKFWLSVLNDLKNRGVQDILITCVDNLTGFYPSHLGLLPEDRNPEMHHPPNPQFDALCLLQRYQESNGGSKAHLQGCNGRNGSCRTGSI